MAVATNGNVGHPTLGRDEIAEIRHAEARASADLIGAELVWMDFDDEWLFNDRPTRERFIDVIRSARPDVVLAHSPNDYHPDHRNAGQVRRRRAHPGCGSSRRDDAARRRADTARLPDGLRRWSRISCLSCTSTSRRRSR